ncbi:chromatin associated protein KTI12 [Phlyctochytrium arcticum]|nr:chromatin associated protein KTI12 [Phlyctochytrium arcticum]
MPLIVLCGLPTSGKTTRARQIQRELEDYMANNVEELARRKITVRPKVILLNEEGLGINKREGYASGHTEKIVRGTLLSAVERHVSREDIVICDGMNYIKGYRYQLYCIVRALGTPHCVVWSAVGSDTAKSWNAGSPDASVENSSESTVDRPEDETSSPSSRPGGGAVYDPVVHANLITRFEEPDGRNRWDAPLFTLLPSDPTPINDLVASLLFRTPPPPNLSTVVKPLTETNYVHEMDKGLSSVVDCIIAGQKDSRSIIIPSLSGDLEEPLGTVRLPPGKMLTMPELRRSRRQYTSMNKLHTQIDVEKVIKGFIDYLNTTIA